MADRTPQNPRFFGATCRRAPRISSKNKSTPAGMSARRGFFSWWFGELREAFSGRAVPSHALALSEHEIALIEKGVDTPLKVVDAEAADLPEQIEGLRSLIAGRRDEDPVVEVQLPSEQVLFSKVTVPGTGDPADAIRGQLHGLTGQAADGLVFDFAITRKPKAGLEGEAVVGVAMASTVDEAVNYARDWGFTPARITSIEAPRAFRRGPDLLHDAARVAGSKLPKIAAGLAALALCLAGAATARALSVRADLIERARAEAAALPAVEDDLAERELALAEFAHAAAMATDLRETTMPVWRILAEIAVTLPSDVVLSGVGYREGQLRLSGTAGSIEDLSESMDGSAIFSGPYFPETQGRRAGTARFVMEVAVDERNIR